MAQPLDLTENTGILRACKNATGSDLAAFRFVKGAIAAVLYPTAIADPVLGVTRAGGIANGTYGSVMINGLAILQVGAGGVTAGTRVGPDTSTGKAIAVAPGAGVNAAVGGIAMQTRAEDEYVLVELTPGAMMQGA